MISSATRDCSAFLLWHIVHQENVGVLLVQRQRIDVNDLLSRFSDVALGTEHAVASPGGAQRNEGREAGPPSGSRSNGLPLDPVPRHLYRSMHSARRSQDLAVPG